MNCKPGDLAIVILGPHAGLLLNVDSLAPREDFNLPDGYPASGSGDKASWLCYVVGSPVAAPTRGGRPRLAKWIVCQDYGLRPIRDPGADATDETLEWLPVPGKQVTA